MISLQNYDKCCIMTLLMRELVRTDKGWTVSIAGEHLGFIGVYTHSRRKKYKYTAVTTMGHEIDSCKTFMTALSQFIQPARATLFLEGHNQKQEIGVVKETGLHFELLACSNTALDDNGSVLWYFEPIDLAISRLMGWVEFA